MAIPTDEKTDQYKAALVRIAKGETSDLAADPHQWSSTIAYLALGGSIVEGKRLDSVDEL